MKENQNQNQNEDKVGLLSITAYGSGEFGNQLSWVMVGTYLSVFYTEVVGFSAATVSLLFLVARLWDAVNDPVMGMICDSTNTKMGKFRPFILFAAPLLAVTCILTFTSPGFLTTFGAKLLWAYVTYIVCGMVYTAITVPYGGLNAVITYSNRGRNLLNTGRFVGQALGLILMNAVTMPIIMANGGTSSGVGYTRTAILFGILALGVYMFTVFGTKENIRPVTEQKKLPPDLVAKAVFRNKYLLLGSLLILTMLFGVMGRTGMMVYYMIYDVGRPDLIPLVMILPNVIAVFTTLAGGIFLKKTDKRVICAVTVAGASLTSLFLYFVPFNNIPLLMVGQVFLGIFLLSAPHSASIISDSIDYAEDKFGVRIDGVAFAVYGLGLKIGIVLGPVIGLAIIGAAGYVANTQQTSEVISAINFATNAVPAIAYGLGFISMLIYNLSDREADEIRARLKAKAAEKARI
jgi:GPH family glycoside/pentoside/hexuronide:cation symporter/probable glucitol transport protein GutA